MRTFQPKAGESERRRRANNVQDSAVVAKWRAMGEPAESPDCLRWQRVQVDIRIRSAPVLKPKATPKLVVLSGLLELTSAELEDAIHSELAENPALQATEAAFCESCGAILAGESCPLCQGSADQTRSLAFRDEWGFGGMSDLAEDDWDPFSTVAAPWSFRDHLLWQLSPQLSEIELEVASLLLENLDAHGLLDCELGAIASAVGVPVSRVEEVLSVVQRQEPVGVAASTVEESLLIQLESLDGDGQLLELCRLLIRDHWAALCKGKLDRIARTLRVTDEEVGRARDFISVNLHPYPIQSWVESPTSAERPLQEAYLRPDVIITVHGACGEQEFEIQFPEERRFRLGLDQDYEVASETLAGTAREENAEAYEHVRRCLERGRLFISGWNERWRTLRRVVEGLVEHQREFLLGDETCLRPLTRAQLAETLGIHESTMSRAVASKYVLLPGGRIVALADFFDGSLRAKSLIKGAVSQETHPLTDGELVDLLAAGGIAVARRTVQKYRQALGILPSELR
jgi:RNA polymerase sigma-54 factor